MRCLYCGRPIRRAATFNMSVVYEHVWDGYTLKFCDPTDPSNPGVAWPRS